jgi:acetate kinase
MIILSLNSGSSSLKFQVYDYEKQATLSTGIVERVTIGDSFIKFCRHSGTAQKLEHNCPDHKEAIKLILQTITDPEHGPLKGLGEIAAVGHRVVHGGEKFRKSARIDAETIETLKELYDLAPLHNPPNVMGIEAAIEVMPNVPHMAVLDTAWHQTMPPHAYMYALPRDWYEEHHVRRYGFHGTSLLYCAKRAAVLLGKDPFDCNLVILHIGNGCSANAVRKGMSFDTSMGLTPLEGLIMGSRAGDHDPAILLFMMEKLKKTPKEMNDILNKKSGILGITNGKYMDRRDVELAAEAGDELAQLAIDMESYRLKKYIGAYMAAVGGADAIVFTAGVGEMSSTIRARSVSGLDFMGVRMDPERNMLARTRNAETQISTDDSRVKIFVIPTDEERVIIEDVVGLLNGTYDEHVKFRYPFQDPNYTNSQRLDEFERECQLKPLLRNIDASRRV